MHRDINSIEDPRISHYRQLRHRRDPKAGDRFVCEGMLVVNRLLASSMTVDSVLVQRGRESQLDMSRRGSVPIYIVDKSMIRQIVGFDFHRGVLAAGIAPKLSRLREWSETLTFDDTLVAAVDIQDPENLGSLIRTCAAFGVRSLVRVGQTVSPFSRRAVRVSMGSVFGIRLLQADDLIADAKHLSDRSGLRTVATSISDDADSIQKFRRQGPTLLAFGTELNGLPSSIQQAADQRVKIPMRSAIDSLNVSIASGIILYEVASGSC